MLHLRKNAGIGDLVRKWDVYAETEARNRLAAGEAFRGPVQTLWAFLSAFRFRFFGLKGYRDGMAGLVISILFAFYRFEVEARTWEAAGCGTEWTARSIACARSRSWFGALAVEGGSVCGGASSERGEATHEKFDDPRGQGSITIAMKTLSIGVVIPAYNAAHVIAEALESALGQKVPPDQVIVVDDGSTDETAQVVRQFGDRVEYVLQPNRGPSAARNCGWGRLETESVVFLDADDLFLPGALAARRALLAQKDTVWASTDGFLQDGAGRRWPFSETYPPGARRAEGWILPDLLAETSSAPAG